MRTFVAIDISDDVRSRVQALLAALQRASCDARWSRPEGLHITLKFLGEISTEDVEQVKQKLHALPPVAPISIRVAGAGFFPNERAPRVLWLGINVSPELRQLATDIDQSLVPLGIRKEDRSFSPHLTLARIRSTNGLAPMLGILRQFEPFEMGSFEAKEFYLYESKLAAGGSVYKKIARFPLTPDAPSIT